MSNSNPNKKIKFTDDNVDTYEQQFKLEHDRAMAYVPHEQKVQDFRQVVMEQFKPPASVEPLMESFRAWIRRNQLARFDCFKEANWECPCYKCATWRAQRESDTDMMEGILQEKQQEQLLGSPASSEKERDMKQAAITKSESPTTQTSHVSVRYACVSHFYKEMPIEADVAPSTPKFSAVDYDLPTSDHGKELAQQKWVKLMQITPTRLTF